jgi:hypothetical protein
MNIKTTIVLLLLLAGVGGYVFFTREKETTETKPVVHTLLDVKSSDVTRFVITGSDGKVIAAQKTTDATGPAVWKLTQPVQATADTFKISSLLDAITSLKSTNQVSASGADAPQTGIDKPQYTVELYEGTKETKVAIGQNLPLGDSVYVKIDGHDMVDVVANSVVDALGKPANDLRKTQLFETASPSVQQLTITHRDGSQLVLEKKPLGWQVIKPSQMPADQSSVEDLISTVVNMTPVEFVDDTSLVMGLNHPNATVSFSTAAPSTQPATTMPNAVTVVFGSYDDLEKKNVFAQIPDGTIVKVAASVLDGLNKKPLDLRDKTVFNLDPATVTQMAILMNQPATTQPTTQPAMMKTTTLIRRKKDVQIGPVLATTGPSSKPTSAPVVKTDWQVAGDKLADADDSKISALLGQFYPFKADKFLERPTTDAMVRQFLVTFTTSGGTAPTVVTLTDPGHDAALVASYNGLTFEVPRTLATDLSAEFKK